VDVATRIKIATDGTSIAIDCGEDSMRWDEGASTMRTMKRTISEPKLTIKQDAFVNALLETGNQFEAYCRAYSCENMSREAIDVEASKLVRNPKITLRLAQFRESKTAESMLTLEGHMEELRSLRDLAKSAGQLSAAISAEVKRGELRRFYVKQIESAHANEFSHMSDEELERLIREPIELVGAVLHNGRPRR
jgi:hypothetical protein